MSQESCVAALTAPLSSENNDGMEGKWPIVYSWQAMDNNPVFKSSSRASLNRRAAEESGSSELLAMKKSYGERVRAEESEVVLACFTSVEPCRLVC